MFAKNNIDRGRDSGLRWWVAGIVGLVGWSVVYSACSPTKVGDDDGANGGGNGGGKGGGAAANGGGKGGNAGAGNGSGSTTGSGGFIISFVDALGESDAGSLPPGTENPIDTLEACGEYTFKVERTPPELMIVFDRSGSMMKEVGSEMLPASISMSRWMITRTAINMVLTATEDDIAWGMKMYPNCKAKDIEGQAFGCAFPTDSTTHNPCAIDDNIIAPGLSQQSIVSTAMNVATPTVSRGATPTAAAMDMAVASLQARTTPNPKFILLATDGVPNCGFLPNSTTRSDTVPDQAGAIAAVTRSAMAGIPVFVLGIAVKDPATTTDPVFLAYHDTLNQMAEAGGRARMDASKYYPALDQARLQTALDEIAAATISCTFPLKEAPRDDAQAAVDVDGKRLPEDATNGWSFAASKKAIIFNGLACDKLKKGEFKETAVTFGCPGKPLPEPPPPAL